MSASYMETLENEQNQPVHVPHGLFALRIPPSQTIHGQWVLYYSHHWC